MLSSAVKTSIPVTEVLLGSEVSFVWIFTCVHNAGYCSQPDPSLSTCDCACAWGKWDKWCSTCWCVCVSVSERASERAPPYLCVWWQWVSQCSDNSMSVCDAGLYGRWTGLDWTELIWSVLSRRMVLTAVTWIWLEAIVPGGTGT